MPAAQPASLLATSVVVLLIGAVAGGTRIGRRLDRAAGLLASALLVVVAAMTLATGGAILASGTLDLRLDGLGALFLGLLGVVGGAAFLAVAADDPAAGGSAMHVLALALVAVFVAGDWLTFLLAWGLAAVAAAALAIPGDGGDRRGMAVLAVAQLAVLLIAVTVALGGAGAWVRSSLLSGLVVGAGVVPCHRLTLRLWGTIASGRRTLAVLLPVGALAVLARAVGDGAFDQPGWLGPAVVAVGVATALWAAVRAHAADATDDLLGALAVVHNGIAMAGIGASVRLGDAVLVAAVSYLLVMTVLGAALSIATGALGAGSGGLDRLAGAGRRAPVTGTMTSLAALGYAALPPLGGFLPAAVLVGALVEGLGAGAARLVPGLLVVALALAWPALVNAAVRFVAIVLGPPADRSEVRGPVSKRASAALAVTAIAGVGLPYAAGAVAGPVAAAVSPGANVPLLGPADDDVVHRLPGLSWWPLGLATAAIVLVAAAAVLSRLLRRAVDTSPAWADGLPPPRRPTRTAAGLAEPTVRDLGLVLQVHDAVELVAGPSAWFAQRIRFVRQLRSRPAAWLQARAYPLRALVTRHPRPVTASFRWQVGTALILLLALLYAAASAP